MGGVFVEAFHFTLAKLLLYYTWYTAVVLRTYYMYVLRVQEEKNNASIVRTVRLLKRENEM